MKTLSKVISALIIAFTFISCEKEVNFNLPADISEKVVVEGSIEQGLPPFVLLTNSIGFTSKIDLSSLQDAFIKSAIVTVSNGTKTVTLREYSIDTLGNAYSFYTVNYDNPDDLAFVGEIGKSYTLKISYKGKTYDAVTTIPQPVALDTIWSEPFVELEEQVPNARKVIVRYNDPIEKGNRFRYYVKQNSRPYLPPTYSTFDDDIINGSTQEFDIFNVVSPMDTTSDLKIYAFMPGDTVSVKLSAIDAVSYDFWQTLEFSVGTTGNPFSTPIKVPSNISNGALGVWTGYAPTYKTVIVE